MKHQKKGVVKRLTDDQVERLCREIYAVHFGYQSAGYSLDRIRLEAAFVPNAEVPGLNITVQLDCGASRPFVYVLTPIVEADVEVVAKAWLDFGQRFNRLPQAERAALFEATQFRREIVAFWAALDLFNRDVNHVEPSGVA